MSHTKEYACWRALKNRCLNAKNSQYKDYGGRGITISESWMKFINFFEDMGICPEGYEIDRIDNNRGYCKENCRWATNKLNARNKRNNKNHLVRSKYIVQQELIEAIGWTKNQFRWFVKKNGISWVLENYKNNTLPKRTNFSLNKDELVGKKLGKWTVLSFVGYKKSDGNRYLCQCECGLEKEVVGYYLRTGKSTQCRLCAYKNQVKKPNPKKSNP